jgi:hypothetical protein
MRSLEHVLALSLSKGEIAPLGAQIGLSPRGVRASESRIKKYS